MNETDKNNYWYLLEEVILAENVTVPCKTFIGQSCAAIPARETPRMPTPLENPQNVFV